jgi:choline monooxygenase
MVNESKTTVPEDIRVAETLPARYYCEPAYFELARERVFAPSWQFAVHADQLNEAGQMVPWTALEGCLNEPLLFTRSSDQRVHCLSNVCTHRGNLIIDKPCRGQQMRCGYHGRRFELDGKFASTPGFEGAANFPSERDNLPVVPSAAWSKFIFACIRPTYEFDDLVGPMKQRLSWLPLDEFVFRPDLSRDYVVPANWAIYVENYLEGFHVPYVHPRLAVLLDTKNYRTELHDLCNVQIGIASAPEDAFALPKESPDYGQQIAAYYYWLFPNTMFNFYPWGLSINIVMPEAVDRARVRFLTYVWDESRMGSYSVDDIDQTEREDEAVVIQVHKGVSSRFYKRGRYSPQWEKGVHHFHRLLQHALD